jgi:serine/threonine-protein phosphatase 6 catalytic subunit
MNEYLYFSWDTLTLTVKKLFEEFFFLGIKFMFDEHLVTVWSAPNYCYRCGNIAAILTFHTATNHETKLFNAVPDSQRVIPSKTTTPYFL